MRALGGTFDLGQWSFEKFSILSTHRHFFSAEWNCLANFGKRPYEEHLREIILNSDQLFRIIMSFKDFSIFSSSSPVVILSNRAEPFEQF